MKLDLNRVLELPGEADVVTADVDLTSVRHAGRPLFTAPVTVTAKAQNRAGVVTLDCTYRFTLSVLCDRCLAPLELPTTRTVSHTVVRAVSGEDDETFLVAEDGIVELDTLATNDLLPALFVCGGLQGPVPDMRQEPERRGLRLPQNSGRPPHGGSAPSVGKLNF